MFPYSLPTGVSLEDVTEMWRSMAMGPEASTSRAPEALQGRLGDFFRNPSTLVRKLRRLAQKRAPEVEEMLREEEKLGKVVWRQEQTGFDMGHLLREGEAEKEVESNSNV